MPDREMMSARRGAIAFVAGLVSAALAFTVAGHAAEPTPSAGSPTTITNGKPAERAGDRVDASGLPAETSPNVFIDGKPAAIGGPKRHRRFYLAVLIGQVCTPPVMHSLSSMTLVKIAPD